MRKSSVEKEISCTYKDCGIEKKFFHSNGIS